MGAAHTGPVFQEPVFHPVSDDDPATVSGHRISARLGPRPGAGTRSTTYLAYAPGGQPVALTVFRPEPDGEAEFEARLGAPFGARFHRDAQAAGRVRGPFTVPVVGSGREGARYWVASAYVPSVSLRAAVAGGGPLPTGVVLRLVAGLAEGLQAVHQAGVVHGGLRPSHVLLAEDGPRLKSYGLGWADEGDEATAFRSPEQAAGNAAVPATDVFALGQIAAYASIGSVPFGDGARVRQSEPDLNELPGQLREIVTRCLIKDPALRPSLAQITTMCAQAAPARPRSTPWLPAPLRSAILSAMPPPSHAAAPDPTVPSGASGPGIPAAADGPTARSLSLSPAPGAGPGAPPVPLGLPAAAGGAAAPGMGSGVPPAPPGVPVAAGGRGVGSPSALDVPPAPPGMPAPGVSAAAGGAAAPASSAAAGRDAGIPLAAPGVASVPPSAPPGTPAPSVPHEVPAAAGGPAAPGVPAPSGAPGPADGHRSPVLPPVPPAAPGAGSGAPPAVPVAAGGAGVGLPAGPGAGPDVPSVPPVVPAPPMTRGAAPVPPPASLAVPVAAGGAGVGPLVGPGAGPGVPPVVPAPGGYLRHPGQWPRAPYVHVPVPLPRRHTHSAGVVAVVAGLAVAVTAGIALAGGFDGQSGSQARSGPVPSVAAAPPGGDATGQPEPQAGTVYAGIRLPAGHAVAFRTGPPAVQPGTYNGDFGLTPQADAFTVQASAGTFALLGPQDPASLATCLGTDATEVTTLPLKSLSGGDRLCVRSADGTTAMVTVRQLPAHGAPDPAATFDLTVWRLDPTAPSVTALGAPRHQFGANFGDGVARTGSSRVN
jgi:Protein kinase domain